MTFPAALRSMLRQAPNIIMIGEIRDLETASIAINASLTGHLVFSTLHTNDAPGAVARSGGHGHQALPRGDVRSAPSWPSASCANSARKCKEPSELTEGRTPCLAHRGKPDGSRPPPWPPSAATTADTRVTAGRMGIFEVFEINDEVRFMINDRLSTMQLRQRARELGHANPARGRRAQGALRRDHRRGSRQCHDGRRGMNAERGLRNAEWQKEAEKRVPTFPVPSAGSALGLRLLVSAISHSAIRIPHSHDPVHDLLRLVLEEGSSDLHITAGSPPAIRLDGQIVKLDLPVWSPGRYRRRACAPSPKTSTSKSCSRNGGVDFALTFREDARFRISLFLQKGSMGMVARLIPNRIRSMEEIGLPAAMHELIHIPRGLILVTGPTGSGKSTSLASMIDVINARFRGCTSSPSRIPSSTFTIISRASSTSARSAWTCRPSARRSSGYCARTRT